MMQYFTYWFAITCLCFIPVYSFVKRLFGGITGLAEIFILDCDEEIPLSVARVMVAVAMLLMAPFILIKLSMFK